MRISRTAVLLGLVLVVAAVGCATSMEIDATHDPAADFSGFKTYAWLPGPQGRTENPRIDDEQLDRFIRRAVDDELAAKGYAKRSSGTIDFLVGYHAAVQSKVDVNTINDYYGYGPAGVGLYHRGPGWGMSTSRTYVREYDEGTLILDVANARNSELAWRASAQAEVNIAAGPEQREERIREAVQRMLERFPPQ